MSQCIQNLVVSAQGQPVVGVLLVQLGSAALQTAELDHPAVRLTLGKQVRPMRLRRKQSPRYVALLPTLCPACAPGVCGLFGLATTD